ncbi:MAG: hypothetical protein GY757_31035, partial [bacterium]|nr:hypothetical protein [bacterium]
PVTTKWEFKRGRMAVTSIAHDTKGVAMGDAFLSGLKVETRMGFPVKSVVLDLIKNHHRIYELHRNRDKISFKAISRLVKDLDAHDLLLLLLDFSDRQSREPDPLNFVDPRTDSIISWYLGKKEEFHISKESIEPIIMGRHLLSLGVSRGKSMGGYLSMLYERQLDGDFSSLEDGLELFRQIKEEREEE